MSAPSTRASRVAVRSVPPRPRVVTLPSGAFADEAGHHRGDRRGAAGRAAGAGRAAASGARSGAARAVPPVRGHELGRVDALRPCGRDAEAPRPRARSRPARRGRPGCRWRGPTGRRARPWHGRSRGTRARPRPGPGSSSRRARRGGTSAWASSRWRRRKVAATSEALAARRRRTRRAPSSSRSVTPARAETTTTSGPSWARIEAHRVANRGGVGQRGAAELPDLQSARAFHGFTGPLVRPSGTRAGGGSRGGGCRGRAGGRPHRDRACHRHPPHGALRIRGPGRTGQSVPSPRGRGSSPPC